METLADILQLDNKDIVAYAIGTHVARIMDLRGEPINDIKTFYKSMDPDYTPRSPEELHYYQQGIQDYKHFKGEK